MTKEIVDQYNAEAEPEVKADVKAFISALAKTFDNAPRYSYNHLYLAAVPLTEDERGRLQAQVEKMQIVTAHLQAALALGDHQHRMRTWH